LAKENPRHHKTVTPKAVFNKLTLNLGATAAALFFLYDDLLVNLFFQLGK
jgi:hypothetical protein